MTSASPAKSDAPVLVVDLDGTLCRTDTLHETLLRAVQQRPLATIRALLRLREGREVFKDELAQICLLEADHLVLNQTVIDLVNDGRAAHRKTALVTATHQRQAEIIATATGLFDEVHGSDRDVNLKGAQKAAFLTDRYGAGGFDYVGDSPADLPVWTAARQAITLGASETLRQQVDAANANARHLEPPHAPVGPALRAMRPHQWSKNILLFLPMVAAHDFSAFWVVCLAALAFCLTASAVYVINDLLDLLADRAHPRKCKRPFAAGELSARQGLILAVGLITGAAVLSLFVGQLLFAATLLGYLVVTSAYSFWLKRKTIVDVITLAGLYTIRILAGGTAAAIVLSPWMLGFSMFLFLGLAAVKRQAELVDQSSTGREISGRGYFASDLPVLRGMALAAAHTSILVLALYINSPDVQLQYASPVLLWLVCPLLLYWQLRMILMTHRGYMTDDPIVYAATDKISALVFVMMVAVVLLAS